MCGEEKDPSLFSPRNPNICLACEFGENLEEEAQDDAKAFVPDAGVFPDGTCYDPHLTSGTTLILPDSGDREARGSRIGNRCFHNLAPTLRAQQSIRVYYQLPLLTHVAPV